MGRALHTAGSVVFVLLGTAHLVGHATGPAEADLEVFQAMRAYTIELMGTHDLMQFYTGFSLAMGALMIAFGVFAGFVGRRHPDAAVSALAAVLTGGVGLLAVVYFHPLAWGLAFLSAGLYAMAAARTARA